MNPFIKWAGGKRRFAEQIVSLLGQECHRYYEPFLGVAAIMLFNEYPNAFGFDTNEELINLYLVVKNDVEALIAMLEADFLPNHSKEFYYQTRCLDRQKEAYNKLSSIQRAARFVYLNKTCYNGLWRVNRKGENNVPFGRYAHPAILQSEVLRSAHDYFVKGNVNFEVADYSRVLDLAKEGDIVYFDPPYDLEPGQNSFVSYTLNGFTREDQKKLKSVCDTLVNKGVTVGVSNSNTLFIRELYTEGPYNYYELHDELSAKRSIGSTAESRRDMCELFIIGRRS
jgi:DNA adenine methylase